MPDFAGGNHRALAARELFSKTFDEILFVAPTVMSNSREFFEEKIAYSLPNFVDKDELFRTYLIFDSSLKNANEHFTPRQIISFINELSGLFAMHQGQFPLYVVLLPDEFLQSHTHTFSNTYRKRQLMD